MKITNILLLSLLALSPIASHAKDMNVQPPSSWSKTAPVFNAWLEVSESALDFNIKRILTQLNGQSELCAILKGDAYGHDLSLVTNVMLNNNVPCIGVASHQEIKTVRDLGFTGRLMRVRSATLDEIQQARAYHVEEFIGNADLAQAASALIDDPAHPLRVHLTLNSAGMSRNGLDLSTQSGVLDLKRLVSSPNLKIVGIMTHFPVEEENNVKAGFARFQRDVDTVFKETSLKREDVILHVANTFATLTVPETWLDLVRVGGIFYGDSIVPNHGYQRVLTFKSRVASVNAYPAGNTVGYDKTYTLNRDSLLANIPLGYSDGYRREFSNRGTVLIQGQRAPVLGKTSMNTIMVDVTDINGVKFGDDVVLYGRQGNDEITQDEIEEISDSLFTEMSILWGATNPRILVK